MRVLEGVHNDSMRLGIVVKSGRVGVGTTAEAAMSAGVLKLSGSSWAHAVRRRRSFSWLVSPAAEFDESREKYWLS